MLPILPHRAEQRLQRWEPHKRRTELLRPPNLHGNRLLSVFTLLQCCKQVKILHCIQPHLQQATIASRKCLHKGAGVFTLDEETFMGVFNATIFLMEPYCWAFLLSKSRLLFEQGYRSPGLICPRPHREHPVCWETSNSCLQSTSAAWLSGWGCQ